MPLLCQSPNLGSLLEFHEVSGSVTHHNRGDDEALVTVEGFYQLHVVCWQKEVKHLQVLLDPGGRHAFGDTHKASLHVPPAADTPGSDRSDCVFGFNRWLNRCVPVLPEYDLGRCFLVSLSNGVQSRVLQQTWFIRRGPWSVPAAQRTVCCHANWRRPVAEDYVTVRAGLELT